MDSSVRPPPPRCWERRRASGSRRACRCTCGLSGRPQSARPESIPFLEDDALQVLLRKEGLAHHFVRFPDVLVDLERLALFVCQLAANALHRPGHIISIGAPWPRRAPSSRSRWWTPRWPPAPSRGGEIGSFVLDQGNGGILVRRVGQVETRPSTCAAARPPGRGAFASTWASDPAPPTARQSGSPHRTSGPSRPGLPISS